MSRGTVWVVVGEHWDTPPVRTIVCATQAGAKAEALKLANLMRREVRLPEETDPENYERALEEALAARRRAERSWRSAGIAVFETELGP